jgi:hypothetical protein
MMSRYEQRRRKLLQDPVVAEGYQEMAAEFQFMQAIEAIRSQNEEGESPLQITTEPDLAI